MILLGSGALMLTDEVVVRELSLRRMPYIALMSRGNTADRTPRLCRARSDALVLAIEARFPMLKCNGPRDGVRFCSVE
jgi:hypothetical protein